MDPHFPASQGEPVTLTPPCRVLSLMITIAGLLFAIESASAQAPRTPTERTIQVSGIKRHYLEYKPGMLGEGAPLVIVLHAGLQSMRKLFRNRRKNTRRWLALAEREKFLLLAPNGTNPDDGDTGSDTQLWNDLRNAGEIGSYEIDDVGFISALIAHAIRHHGVDPDRVYVTGASNGGMMVYRLLVERPELFAAGAAFLANLPEAAVPTAREPTPIMIANGTGDRLVPYAGGMIARQRGMVRSTDATIAYWVGINRVDTVTPTELAFADRDPDDACRMFRTTYPAKAGGGEVFVLTMQGGGHKIPSIRMARKSGPAHPIVGRRCHDAEGADLAWSFLMRHSR